MSQSITSRIALLNKISKKANNSLFFFINVYFLEQRYWSPSTGRAYQGFDGITGRNEDLSGLPSSDFDLQPPELFRCATPISTWSRKS